ncbi:MAG: undecaprenyl-diphosphate phosphatase [Anaerolineae bacterium]|nr:undecaprenyl-diphosphatase UppP [Anaerolineales bacterium]MCQ3975326.1 undecaprenyl-diphosphatase UppP [Anaerolineae bacterium]
MDLFQALILGLVQGLTEYIPVSSSGHLVLVPWLLGWPDAPFTFEVLVQWGTLVGVFIYFWRDIWLIAQGVIRGLIKGQPLATFEAKLGWLVVIATIPAVVFGVLFKDFFESFFSAPVYVGIFIGVTSIILVIAEFFGSRERQVESVSWLDAIVVGLWQVAAMIPGVSRSGATITGGMLRGFTRPAAARFSFLMSIPALGGAGVVALKDLVEAGNLTAELPALTVGFVAAAVSGYFCIRWLLSYLQGHSMYTFVAYRVILSLIVIIVALIRG